jgi:lysozyme
MTKRGDCGSIAGMRQTLFALLLCLAACGGRSPAPDMTAAPVTVSASSFSDADPHDYTGRSPDRYPVHGTDTSRFQTSVDWQTARANGVNFAYVKATEGGDFFDPLFAENFRVARMAGVRVGAYHFWYHCRSGVEQARWFIRNVPRVAGALPPVVDVEWTPFSPTCTRRPPGAEVRREVEAFMDTIEAHYGQRPLVYVSPDIYADAGLSRLRGAEFWLRSVAGHPSEVYPGQAWTFWQYSGTGGVPGIAGKADLNVFAGSARGWAEWLAIRAQ